MQINVIPTIRAFDNRTVYAWQLIDSRGRLRDSGVQLTHDAAKRAARRSKQDQGPDVLLDKLECKP